jgi:hypothetical protein
MWPIFYVTLFVIYLNKTMKQGLGVVSNDRLINKEWNGKYAKEAVVAQRDWGKPNHFPNIT